MEESERDRDEIKGRDGSQSESIKVLVRVRPLNSMEAAEEASSQGTERAIEIFDGHSIKLSKASTKKVFECRFDSVAGPASSQADIYRAVSHCTASVLSGTNSTIFAYGQTGSGKTYSMYGPPSEGPRDESMGIIPRVIIEIFQQAHSIEVLSLSVYCSFVQIYNENLFDMLRDVDMSSPLTLREESKKGAEGTGSGVYKKHGEQGQGEIYVQGLSEFCVKDVRETLLLLGTAERNRKIRETAMNLFSSRSHSIFQIFVEQKRVASDGGEVSLTSKFNLVDLAGSEKWKPLKDKERELSDEHVAEMTNINLSLHTLGRCISALASRAKGKSTHVPYRDSKLTRLLQDSLGGNARTFLIATVSSSSMNLDESISTLKFADRAKQVMVTATVNEVRPVDHLLVQRLMKEVEHLRRLLKKYSSMPLTASTTLSAGHTAMGETDREADIYHGQQTQSQTQSQVSTRTLTLADDMWSRAMSLADTMDGREGQEGHGQQTLGLGQQTHGQPDKVVGAGWGRTKEMGSPGGGGQSVGRVGQVGGYREGDKGTEAERERVREENRVLKKEINALKARHLHDLKAEEKKIRARGEEEREGGNIYHQSEVAYNSLKLRETATWMHVEKLQAVMNKFFSFKMEEDDMRSNVSEIFKQLEYSNKQHVSPLPVPLENKSRDMNNNTSRESGNNMGRSIETSSTSPMGPGAYLLPLLHSPSSVTHPRGRGSEGRGPDRGVEAFRGDKKVVPVPLESGGSNGGAAYRLRGGGGGVGPSAVSTDTRGGRNRIVFDSNAAPEGHAPSVVEEAEKELRILRELREAKNKMRQQQELLDWVREKDLKVGLKGGS